VSLEDGSIHNDLECVGFRRTYNHNPWQDGLRAGHQGAGRVDNGTCHYLRGEVQPRARRGWGELRASEGRGGGYNFFFF
jgi:hypothetical protein